MILLYNNDIGSDISEHCNPHFPMVSSDAKDLIIHIIHGHHMNTQDGVPFVYLFCFLFCP